MLSPVQTATAGLIAASDRLGAAATQVAGLDGAPSGLPEAAQVGLSDAAMELIGAKTGFSINLAVLASSMRMERQVVDFLV